MEWVVLTIRRRKQESTIIGGERITFHRSKSSTTQLGHTMTTVCAEQFRTGISSLTGLSLIAMHTSKGFARGAQSRIAFQRGREASNSARNRKQFGHRSAGGFVGQIPN